jgi:hypothetical protein
MDGSTPRQCQLRGGSAENPSSGGQMRACGAPNTMIWCGEERSGPTVFGLGAEFRGPTILFRVHQGKMLVAAGQPGIDKLCPACQRR